MKYLCMVLFGVATLLAQEPKPAAGPVNPKEMSDAEQKDLRNALGEAGSAQIEFVRALERHLGKYPNSPQKEEIENAIAKAAVEIHDDARTLQYGAKVLGRNKDNPVLLERMARILSDRPDRESNEQAMLYAKRFEEIMRGLQKEGLSSNRNKGPMLEELDRALGRALLYQARATANLGKVAEGVALARAGYGQAPTGEGARELARLLVRDGKEEEAVRWYADALMIPDPKVTAADRAADRRRLGELYIKLHKSETGLGDVVLQALDRTAAQMAKRSELEKQRDPNADVTDPMNFTVSGLNGEKLNLGTLKGKVVVLDFWATWCGPCRVQQPLYEEVKKRFEKNDNVVFLAISNDEDQSVVKPFLEANKWSKKVYFEDGLATLLKVNSIPATIIFDKEGKLASRMNGFVPERFVDMLSERIKEALH